MLAVTTGLKITLLWRQLDPVVYALICPAVTNEKDGG